MAWSLNKFSRLKILTCITVGVLAGIIALQIYWLVTSYKEQQSRFTADIESAISTAVVKVELGQGMDEKIKGVEDSVRAEKLLQFVFNMVDKIPKELLTQKMDMEKTVLINLDEANIKVDSNMNQEELLEQLAAALQNMADTIDGKQVVKKIGEEEDSSFFISKSELVSYKQVFRKEFHKRKIVVPFELAVTDSSGTIKIATCDTGAFRKVPVKSSNALLLSSKTSNYSLQAAFPDANLYLLKRMAWILVITLLLILIGAFSLSYLLVLFFRHKRIAEIRNDFMNNMTHELKTPISSISVAMEMVLDQRYNVDEDKKKKYLRAAQGELTRLNVLVDKVLKLSLFERSEIVIVKESLNVKSWLRDIERSLKPMLERGRVELDIHVHPESLVIALDRTHFTNVIHNLIENALKYNDKDTPRIHIEIKKATQTVQMTIQDNGIGIPEKYMDKIFDKFFRVPNGDRHDRKGYGLGLSYVKAVVELHGGTVSVISTLHGGSTFIVYLPL